MSCNHQQKRKFRVLKLIELRHQAAISSGGRREWDNTQVPFYSPILITALQIDKRQIRTKSRGVYQEYAE